MVYERDRSKQSHDAPIAIFEWMTPDEHKVNPTCRCERIPPRLDPLLGHLTDIFELCIDHWERTAFYLVGSCHDDSLPGFLARLSSRDIMQVSVLASLHEPRVHAADRGLVETPHVATEFH